MLRQILGEPEVKSRFLEGDSLLREGLVYSVLGALATLCERKISSEGGYLKEEILAMLLEIQETYLALQPSPRSNWLSECAEFGEKKAYHWEWKYFGSKELF